MKNNKTLFDFYNKIKTVNFYASYKEVQPFETHIIKFIEKNNQIEKTYKMLDIGIGAGRTTHVFADIVLEYHGIDISENMIKHCKKIFMENNSNKKFYIMDACSLETFSDNYFDLVLFSLNGIDFMDIENRKKCLSEIWRVLKFNGKLYFTSHNIKSIEAYYMFSFKIKIKMKFKELIRFIKVRFINGSLNSVIKKDSVMFYEGESIKDNFFYFYSNCITQPKLLSDIGFNSISIYSFNGKLLTSDEMNTCKDNSLGYECSK